jgi:CHAD domain-containing protein
VTRPGTNATGATRVAPFVARKMKVVDGELAAALPRVMQASDAEAVHDMRVAIRRLRTLLRLARPVYGRFHADSVRLAFAQVQSATGELRDEEVLGEAFAALDLKDDGFAQWRERRHVRERRLRRAVLARLRAGELRRARAMLRALLVLPVKPSHNEALGKFARRAVERARKQAEGMRDAPTSDVERLHELRIAYKKLRYAAELLTEALPIDLSAMAAPAARFQKRLGDIHDLDMALAAVARARGLSADTRTVVMEKLNAARTKKVQRYLEEMSPAGQPAQVRASVKQARPREASSAS